MARRVAAFEEQALCLSADVFLAIPTQYRERPEPDDALSSAWNRAVDAAMRASIELEQLGDLLRAKAGIEEPGPTAQFRIDGSEKGEGGVVAGESGADPNPKDLPS